MRVVFFNHYHNGDVFATKEYVRQIIDHIPDAEFFYQHFNSPKLLADLPVTFVDLSRPMGQIVNRTSFLIDGDDLFLNTWIGNHLDIAPGINWVTYNAMFKRIFDWLRDAEIASIPKRKASFYIPEIDFSCFDVGGISVPENSILISNGPSMSGQSSTEGFDELAQRILESTDYNIILTHPSSVGSGDRIFYTSGMIRTVNGDLNEISFIAERCSVIIGRNSGPFCFTHTKNIINDSSKKMIAVGNKKHDCFTDGMKTECQYIFINDDHEEVTNRIMEEL